MVQSGGAAPVTLSSGATPFAWFDASDINADGATPSTTASNLTTWKDKSGNGYNATAVSGTGGKYNPTITNGKPGVTIVESTGSVGNGFQTTPLGRTLTMTVFAVFTPAPTSAPNGRSLGIIWGQYTSDSNFDYPSFGTADFNGCNGAMIFSQGSALAPNLFSNSFLSALTTPPQPILISYTVRSSPGPNGVSMTVYGNGISFTSPTDDTGYNPSVSGTASIKLGTFVAGNPVKGSISEVIHYQSALSDADIAKVQSYLAGKWGLADSVPAALPLAVSQRISSYSSSVPWSVSGLTSWFDATDINADGATPPTTTSNITLWKDKSANIYNATAVSGTGGVYNATITNGKPGVTFVNNSATTVGNGFKTASLGRGAYVTVFVVFTPSTDITGVTNSSAAAWAQIDITTSPSSWSFDYYNILAYNTSSNLCKFLIQQTDKGIKAVTGFWGPSSYLPAARLNPPQPVLLSFITKASTGSDGITFSIIGNGVTSSTSLSFSSNTLPTPPGTNAPITFGYQPVGGTSALDGSISEIIHYNTELSTPDVYRIQGYLATKWGIAPYLPTTHPYYNAASFATVTYTPGLPATISGLTTWFDATDPNNGGTIPGNLTNMNTWRDKSGNGYDATNASIGGQYNTTVCNGKPGVSFGGTTNGLSVTTGGFQTAQINKAPYVTAFMVFTPSIQNFNEGGYLGDPWAHSIHGEDHYCIRFNQPGSSSTLTHAGGSYLGSPVTPAFSIGSLTKLGQMSPPQPVLITFVASGSGLVLTAYGNGTNLTGQGVFSSLPYSPTGTAPITLGTDPNNPGSYKLNGALSEVIQYNNTLLASDIYRIQGYLATKWGIAAYLPAGHPYVNAPSYASVSYIPPTPLTISGLTMWYDAKDINGDGTTTSNGAAITTWKDKSGNGLTLTGGTAGSPGGTYNTTIANNNPGVSMKPIFSGGTSTGFTTTTAIPLLTNTSIFIVFTPTTSLSIPGQNQLNGSLVGQEGSSSYLRLLFNVYSIYLQYPTLIGPDTGGDLSNLNKMATPPPFLLTYVSSPSGVTITIYANGYNISRSTTSLYSTSGQPAIDTVQFGYLRGGGNVLGA